jgi:multiple sugar transport system substrate-binding protein
MIPLGHNRPAIPEYPQIASHIKQVLDDVYYGLKDTKHALDDADARSAAVVGWLGQSRYFLTVALLIVPRPTFS